MRKRKMRTLGIIFLIAFVCFEPVRETTATILNNTADVINQIDQ